MLFLFVNFFRHFLLVYLTEFFLYSTYVVQKNSTNGSQSHLKFKIVNAAKMTILSGFGQENGLTPLGVQLRVFKIYTSYIISYNVK